MNRVCTCEKRFMEEEPVVFRKSVDEEYEKLPSPVTEEILTQLRGNIWHILGCRGCCFTKEQIEKNFETALRSSIVSCVYQKNDNGVFEYLSDSIDPHFENYCIQQGIKIGEPAGIKMGN